MNLAKNANVLPLYTLLQPCGGTPRPRQYIFSDTLSGVYVPTIHFQIWVHERTFGKKLKKLRRVTHYIFISAQDITNTELIQTWLSRSMRYGGESMAFHNVNIQFVRRLHSVLVIRMLLLTWLVQ